MLSAAAEVEEDHADDYECQIERLGLEVALAEEQRAACERHDHRAAADHRDDRYHGIRIAQGHEVGHVGGREQDRDHGYGP